MKNTISLILTLMFFFSQSTTALESDPPVLNGISLDKNTIDVSSNSETITFSLDVYDESGIERATMFLESSGGMFLFSEATAEDPTKISFTFDSSYPEGEYIINALQIYDVNGNEASYHTNVDVSEFSITIINQQEAGELITYAALDIDQNGSFDALTDGLILLRYAFGLRGESLIDSVIDSNANRTNAADIEAHIQSLVP
jgi:hypothetical protein